MLLSYAGMLRKTPSKRHSSTCNSLCGPQADYDMAYASRITVLNRPDVAYQDRIKCFQLLLQDPINQTIYSFNFTAAASSYNLRDVSTAAVQTACRPQPPPPPPSPPRPPLPPVPVTPVCANDAGTYMHYVRIAWRGGATCSYGFLNVAELRVLYNGVNVARGAPATALDKWADSASYAPDKLVDGSSSTMYHSKTVGSGTYVEVNLQVRSWRWWRGGAVAGGGGAVLRLLVEYMPCVLV